LLELNKYLVRQEIRGLLLANPGRLIVVRVDNPSGNPEYRRIHSGEFRYKGKMYDIAIETQDGSATIFLCLHDKKEETLFKGLRKNSENRFNSQWWDHVIKIAFPVSFLFSNIAVPEIILFKDCERLLPAICIPVHAPPPKLTV
jgi:hypothetical protein